jgi:hypothetical protein
VDPVSAEFSRPECGISYQMPRVGVPCRRIVGVVNVSLQGAVTYSHAQICSSESRIPLRS